MAYIETIKRGKQDYHYLTHTLRSGDKYKKIRRFIGKGKISKEKLNLLAKSAQKSLDNLLSQERSRNVLYRLPCDLKKELSEIKKDYQKIIKKLSPVEYGVIEKQHLIRFTFNTNAIEGNTITLKETSHILEDGIVPGGKELKEVHEIENTRSTYGFLKKYKRDVSISLIKKIHYNLTFNVLDEQAGKYRSIQVFMGGSKHTPPKPRDVSSEMNHLFRWISNHKKMHSVVFAAYVHHLFIAIHPFIDGNGRTGRLLLNFMLMKAGFPPICIRLKERIKYTDLLEQARDGDPSSFIEFIISKVKEAYSDTLQSTS